MCWCRSTQCKPSDGTAINEEITFYAYGKWVHDNRALCATERRKNTTDERKKNWSTHIPCEKRLKRGRAAVRKWFLSNFLPFWSKGWLHKIARANLFSLHLTHASSVWWKCSYTHVTYECIAWLFRPHVSCWDGRRERERESPQMLAGHMYETNWRRARVFRWSSGYLCQW